MRVHLVNPSDISFGVAVITPRWLYVLAAATPSEYGTPRLVDETLQQLNLDEVDAGDVVGISIHTGIATHSARHGRAGKMARLIAKPCRPLFVAKATA